MADDDRRDQPFDHAVWRGLNDGDPTALAELFDRHSRAVYNFAFRRTASWSSAEEIVQATFVTVWQRARRTGLPALDHPSALPWLLGVADHESRNLRRGGLRRRLLEHRLGSVLPAEHRGTDHADEVAERLDDERRMTAVRAAVATLPPHERATIELVVWSGLSTHEAATTLGVAEGTVKSRLARARGRLGLELSATADGRTR